MLTIKDLVEIALTALHKEGEDLEVVTTGHYGEPNEYSRDNFYVKTIDTNERINPIKPKKVFNIEHIDIGPEPD